MSQIATCRVSCGLVSKSCYQDILTLRSLLEAARPLTSGFDCRVRLADGSLEEVVLSDEEAAALAKASAG